MLTGPASPNEQNSRREPRKITAASDFFAMARGLPRKTRAMAKKRSGYSLLGDTNESKNGASENL
jgi:hypothetical protein